MGMLLLLQVNVLLLTAVIGALIGIGVGHVVVATLIAVLVGCLFNTGLTVEAAEILKAFERAKNETDG